MQRQPHAALRGGDRTLNNSFKDVIEREFRPGRYLSVHTDTFDVAGRVVEIGDDYLVIRSRRRFHRAVYTTINLSLEGIRGFQTSEKDNRGGDNRR